MTNPMVRLCVESFDKTLYVEIKTSDYEDMIVVDNLVMAWNYASDTYIILTVTDHNIARLVGKLWNGITVQPEETSRKFFRTVSLVSK